MGGPLLRGGATGLVSTHRILGMAGTFVILSRLLCPQPHDTHLMVSKPKLRVTAQAQGHSAWEEQS